MRVSIESTIPSYVVARTSRDLYQATRQQLTKDWWEFRRHRYELYTSQVTLDEIAGGEKEMANRRAKTMAGIPILDLSTTAEEIAEFITKAKLLPARADNDIAHISLATTHRMDILLTWNCRHIANAQIEMGLRRLVRKRGFELPVIATPETLMGATYE